MTVLVIIAVWIVCSVLAFVLFLHEWRRSWDVDLPYLIGIGIISIFGPLVLMRLLVLKTMEWADSDMHKTILPKYKDKG